MPQPTQSQLHVDVLLTNILVGFKNATYIADDSAPILPVPKQTNLIARMNQSAWFRNDAKLRATGTRSARSGYTVDNTLSYYCPRFSLGHEIPDEVRDMADAPYDTDRDSALFIANALTLAREIAFATNVFASAPWTTLKTAGVDFNQWSNYAGSLPLDDIQQWKDVIEGLIGVEANNMVIGKQVWVGSGGLSNGGGLKWHPQVLDTIKYTQKAQIGPDLFASLVEIDNFKIGRAIFTSTVEGVAEASVTYSRVFGKNALLYYNTPGPAIMASSSLMTIVWNRVANAIQYIKRVRNEENEYDLLEGNSYFTHKVLLPNAGLFGSGVVA